MGRTGKEKTQIWHYLNDMIMNVKSSKEYSEILKLKCELSKSTAYKINI